MKHLWALNQRTGGFDCQACGGHWVWMVEPETEQCATRTQAEYDKAMAEMRERQKASWAKVGGEGSL